MSESENIVVETAEKIFSDLADAQTIKVADIIDNTKSIVRRDPGFAEVYLKEKAALLEVLTKADAGLRIRAGLRISNSGVA